MFKKIFVVLLIMLFSQEILQAITVEKISDFYRADLFVQIDKNADFIIATGCRSLHFLRPDENGKLQEIAEQPLTGVLIYGSSPTAVFENYVYSLSTIENMNSCFQRLYKININQGHPFQEDYIEFTNSAYLHQIMNLNNFLVSVSNTYIDSVIVYEPESFEKITSYSLTSFFQGDYIYKINNNYAYTIDLTDDNIVHIFDVTNVRNIVQIADIDRDEEPYSEILFGTPIKLNDSTFVMCHPNKYSFIDISDITNWRILGSIDFTTDYFASYTIGILPDNKVIIPSYNQSTQREIRLYDISNLSVPVLLSSAEYFSINFIPFGICYENNYYLCDWGNGINELSVNGNQIEFRGKFPQFTSRRYVCKYDNLILVSSYYLGGLYIFDISNPENPHYLTTYLEDNIVYYPAVDGNYLAVPYITYPAGEIKADVYDITNIRNPILVNRLNDANTAKVYLDYPFLYTLKQTDYDISLVKYDLSSSFSPLELYDYYLGRSSYNFKHNNYFCYYNRDTDLLEIYDISGDYPELAGTFTDGNPNNLQGVAFRNNKYMEFINMDECNIFEAENPLEPDFMFSCQYEGNPYHFEFYNLGIHNNIMVQGFEDIRLYDISNGYEQENYLERFEISFISGWKEFYEYNGNKYFLLFGETDIAMYRYSFNDVADDNVVNNKQSVLSNFPNPFTASTTISFSGSNEQKKQNTISIYNIKGQKVKEFVIPSGVEGNNSQFSITWNGTDNNGKKVSSGVYLYQLKINDKTVANRKCILLN